MKVFLSIPRIWILAISSLLLLPYHRPEVYFKQGLNPLQRKRITEANRSLKNK